MISACSDEANSDIPFNAGEQPRDETKPLKDFANEREATYLFPLELLTSIKSIAKSDFESSQEFRQRLQRLDRKYNDERWLTFIETENFRWDYDADQRLVSYNFDAMGTLNLEFARSQIEDPYEQLWPILEGRPTEVLEHVFLASRPCSISFFRIPQEAQQMRIKGGNIALIFDIENFSQGLQSDLNLDQNISWESNIWREPMVHIELHEVIILDSDFNEIETIGC